ncbi:hypothetical protein K504DRAFT_295743 [Pleomassaria siparia CBS 279.74]|uniref:PhoD-like phosphatase domain-containing protein n=1 Tax=Pleomassaria siparia CBS 279.74 TaxID=1314801 RepID=A0A6G1K8H9_9PLEO|nr:hypothetical protein K504DRAFT_295743 [Pleomassaria siparia CBS 279.74]
MTGTITPHEDASGVTGVGLGPQLVSTTQEMEVMVGPLLNYRRMSNETSGAPIWHGSVLVVTSIGQQHPELTLSFLGDVNQAQGNTPFTGEHSRVFLGQKLYEDPRKAFWRFLIDLPFQQFESRWEYTMRGFTYLDEKKTEKPQVFAVPSIAESMRILFHSCNGFSVGTDIDAWSGPALWNDVLRMHQQKPFHVMIGGGDQIYNDGVRVDGPLRAWTDISNPHKRREYPFGHKMRDDCDEYYFQNYIRWYAQKPFSTANGQIPQLNIWDDHDIIDGFGSYTDKFMKCHVFRGIGGVAHKYYMLFQQHMAPPKSTFTSDAPKTVEIGPEGTPADPVQLDNTFVMTDDVNDPSYINGQKPGPYVEETSRSIYCQLGARIAFCGLDARTERTRHQINYPETYKLIFDRLDAEFTRNPQLKHLVLLLGVPIAYPRLQWLENIFASPLIAPIKFLNKRFGFGGSIFNKFDGNVDLLDDLDDHYTAHQHKHERRDLVHLLQNMSKKHNVRVTILGGDVHLAAVGRFFSNPKLGIPAEHDYRYMPNVVSSAITNKPPPQAVANLLARRNKIHHLDHDTDETLLEIFDRDPRHNTKSTDGVSNGVGTNGVSNGNGNGVANGSSHNGSSHTGSANGPATNNPVIKVVKKTSDANHATMPSRNYAIIAESHPDPSSMSSPPVPVPGQQPEITSASELQPTNGAGPIHPATEVSPAPTNPKGTRKPIHAGEEGAGTQHPAANGLRPTGLCGPFGLDVSIRVEISPSDPEGRTDGYGFSIPALQSSAAYADHGSRW